MGSRTGWIVVRLIAAAIIVAGAVGAAAQEKGPDAEFTKLADEFSRAWAKGDAKAIAALHTDDAIRLPGNGQVIAGRAAIEANYSQGLSGPWKGSKIEITPGRTLRLTDDAYVSEGRFQITGGSAPTGVPTSGQYSNAFVRRGGRWLVASSAVIFAPTSR
jgi:uncharacterized protein (TIGR02246 family)